MWAEQNNVAVETPAALYYEDKAVPPTIGLASPLQGQALRAAVDEDDMRVLILGGLDSLQRSLQRVHARLDELSNVEELTPTLLVENHLMKFAGIPHKHGVEFEQPEGEAGDNQSPRRPSTTYQSTSDKKKTNMGVAALLQKPKSAPKSEVARLTRKVAMHYDMYSKKKPPCALQKIRVWADWWERVAYSYKPKDSLCYRLEKSQIFGMTSSTIIIANAVFIAFIADWEMAHPMDNLPVEHMLVETAFLLFFALELGVRGMAHGRFFFLNSEMKWNLFDLILVLASGFDLLLSWMSPVSEGENIGFMRIFRVCKLAKILRALRVMRVFSELAQILESFSRCFASLWWSFVMLFFMIYVFALIFTQGLTTYRREHGDAIHPDVLEDIENWFRSVPISMQTLYMAVTGGDDWVRYFNIIKRTGESYSLLFLFFTFFFVFALFNILTGIFVEKAVASASPDREELILRHRESLMAEAEEFRHLCERLDLDKTGKISMEEFKKQMENETMVSYMASVGLEMHDVELFFNVVADSDEAKEVDIDMFVQGCMAMKGQATALDVQKMLYELRRLHHNVKNMETQLEVQADRIQELGKKSVRRNSTMPAAVFTQMPEPTVHKNGSTGSLPFVIA